MNTLVPTIVTDEPTRADVQHYEEQSGIRLEESLYEESGREELIEEVQEYSGAIKNLQGHLILRLA